MKAITKGTDVLIKILEWVDYICMAALVIILFLQVVLRYFFNTGLVWSEDLAKTVFVWIVFISISLQVYSNSYLEFNLLQSKLKKNKTLVYVITRVCIFVFFVVLGYYGYIYTIASKDQILYSLNLSMSWLYMIIPITAVLSVYFLVVRTINDLLDKRKEAAA